jgi:hypothetical protein
MKSLLVIAMALVSVSSFAADNKDAGHKAAMEACVAEKMKAPATEAAPAAAPAPAHK